MSRAGRDDDEDLDGDEVEDLNETDMSIKIK